MITHTFTYEMPDSLDKASHILRQHQGAEILIGGYGLVQMMKKGAIKPSSIVSLDEISDLKLISKKSDGLMRIGAANKLSDVLSDAQLQKHFPILMKVVGTLGDHQMRNQTAIGDKFIYANNRNGLATFLAASGSTYTTINSQGSLKDGLNGPIGELKDQILFIDLPLSADVIFYDEFKDLDSKSAMVSVCFRGSQQNHIIKDCVIFIDGQKIKFDRLQSVEHYLVGKKIDLIDFNELKSSIDLKINTQDVNQDYIINLIATFLFKGLKQNFG